MCWEWWFIGLALLWLACLLTGCIYIARSWNFLIEKEILSLVKRLILNLVCEVGLLLKKIWCGAIHALCKEKKKSLDMDAWCVMHVIVKNINCEKCYWSYELCLHCIEKLVCIEKLYTWKIYIHSFGNSKKYMK